MAFLETITTFDNTVFVPINRIKYIHCTYKTGWEIHIVSDDGDWIEYFEKDTDLMNKRLFEIKRIIGAK